MSGIALANSGSSDFQSDPREDFILMLRDFSSGDLRELKLYAPLPPAGNFGAEARFKMRRSHQNLGGERLSRATRLVGSGLLEEELMPKPYTGPTDFRLGPTPSGHFRTISNCRQLSRISGFGWKFLQFITEAQTSAPKES
jgi:hypothetical protein